MYGTPANGICCIIIWIGLLFLSTVVGSELMFIAHCELGIKIDLTFKADSGFDNDLVRNGWR